MKKLIWTTDNEIVFYEDEVKKACNYFGIEDACESLEDVAMFWNEKHCSEGIGELKVRG